MWKRDTQAVDKSTDGGFTINLRVIDNLCAPVLSKSFDKLNRCGFIVKLVNVLTPNALLENALLIENLLSKTFYLCSTWMYYVSLCLTLSERTVSTHSSDILRWPGGNSPLKNNLLHVRT